MRDKEMGFIIESIDDFINDNGRVRCACGDSQLTLVAHGDGRKRFAAIYNCKCGNIIKITYKRTEEDLR